ncbi:MAG: efflux RND transporter periplasmic adaptor subunit [Salipiger thiooxidans]
MAVAATLLLLPATPALPQQAGGGATEVGLMTLESRDVPFTVTVPGRAVAHEQVDVRPRVGGVNSEIVYELGRPVEAGDVLFRIENQTCRAEVASSEVGVALAEASVAAAQETVTRYERLLGTGVTQEDLVTAQVSLKQAQADQSAAEVALEVAQLDLDRTEIRSPIAGFPSVPTISVGALVTEKQTDALTTVARLDPIYVDVEESIRRMGEIRDKMDAGALQPGDGLDIELESGGTYAAKGRMVSPGTTICTTTGTRRMRIAFDNPELRLMPGQVLRVEVVLGTTNAVLVAQGATSRSASGVLTAFVAVDGKAEQRELTEQGSYRNAWVVTDGIAPGEALIVDGLTRLQNGTEVSAVPVTISEDGVATDAEPAAVDGAAAGSGPRADALTGQGED